MTLIHGCALTPLNATVEVVVSHSNPEGRKGQVAQEEEDIGYWRLEIGDRRLEEESEGTALAIWAEACYNRAMLLPAEEPCTAR